MTPEFADDAPLATAARSITATLAPCFAK